MAIDAGLRPIAGGTLPWPSAVSHHFDSASYLQKLLKMARTRAEGFAKVYDLHFPKPLDLCFQGFCGGQMPAQQAAWCVCVCEHEGCSLFRGQVAGVTRNPVLNSAHEAVVYVIMVFR